MPSARCTPVPGIADARAGNQWYSIAKTRRRSCPAGALGDVFVGLAVFEPTWSEPLHRRDDDLGVDRVDFFPREPHPVERAGGEILDEDVADFDERLQHVVTIWVLGVQRNRTLVAVHHREVQAVDIRNVTQLGARDVAGSRALDLDHVGAEPGEKLRANRPGLDMREVQDPNTFEWLGHRSPLFQDNNLECLRIGLDMPRPQSRRGTSSNGTSHQVRDRLSSENAIAQTASAPTIAMASTTHPRSSRR